MNKFTRSLLFFGTFLLVSCETYEHYEQNEEMITQFWVQDNQLLMNNLINSQTLKQFNTIIEANPEVDTLVELDVPGSIDDETMIKLAYRVRELGMNTMLLPQSKVYSGGVDLFLAGVKRTISKGAIIGVHSWSDGEVDAKDVPRDDPSHEDNRAYIEKMLGDDSFYWFTIYAAAANDMHTMTAEEIVKYKLAN